MWKFLDVKYPLFLSDFKESWTFSTYFRKTDQISCFVKIHPVGTDLFNADGQDEANTIKYIEIIIQFFQRKQDKFSTLNRPRGIQFRN